MVTVIADRYRLDERIGHGGMGQVWRARDLRLGRDVAVKTVDRTALADASMAARFQQETTATARLSHPNIVTVFDGGVDASTAYLVMELLPGRTLADEITAQGRLPIPQAVAIARQVVTALAAAHAVGLVHRDIKPANVMLAGDRVKLVDFGIAQLANRAGASLTATATTIGTAAYMAPEQAGGRAVGPATDLYAVGCLLMAMVTGAPPFEGEAIAVAGRQLVELPPRLSSRRPDVPPALDALVDGLLAKDPAARPTAAQTLAALGSATAIAMVPVLGAAVPAASATSAVTSVVPPLTAPPATMVASDRTLAALAPAGPPPSNLPWMAGVLVSLMTALVLAGLAFSLARGVAPAIARMIPTAAATKATPSRSPSVARPTATPSAARPTPTVSTPAAGSAALEAALATVRTALTALPAGKTKDQLIRHWDKVATTIAAGKDATKRVQDFEVAVDAAHDLGVIGGLQYQAIKGALAAVKAFA